MGPEVYELEKKLAEYVGVKHCISCASGTDALLICSRPFYQKFNGLGNCPCIDKLWGGEARMTCTNTHSQKKAHTILSYLLVQA